MLRVRQFGELRRSRRSHQSNNSGVSHSRSTSRTHQSTLVCVGCVNQSLSKLKQEKLNAARQLQVSFMQNNQSSLRELLGSRSIKKAKKIQEETKAMIEYNMQIVRQRSAKKEQLKKTKQQERKFIEQMSLRQKQQSQKARRRERLLRQKCINDLKLQITHHQEQKIKQKIEKINHSPEKGILEERISNFRKQLDHQYRRELAKQVQEESNRKRALKEQAKQEIAIKAIPFLDRAEKRQQVIHELEEQRKIVLLEEARQRERERKALKEKASEKKVRQRNELQSRLREDDQARRTRIDRKKRNIEHYRKELKEQIQEKDKLRRESKQARIQEHQEPFCYSHKKQQLTRACDSCEKQVPQISLTRLKRPL